jgi:hypothetical protein
MINDDTARDGTGRMMMMMVTTGVVMDGHTARVDIVRVLRR